MKNLWLALALALAPIPLQAGTVSGPAASRPAGAPLALPRTTDGIFNGYFAARQRFQAAIDRVAAVPAGQRDFRNTVLAFERARAEYTEELYRVTMPSEVATDPELREAARLVEDDAGEFGVALYLREDLFAALEEGSRDLAGRDEQDRRLAERMVQAFRENGLGLPPAERRKLKELSERLSKLENRFSANINEDSPTMLATAEELKGLSPDFTAGLKRAEDGRFVVPAKGPAFVEVMRLAERSDTRRRMQQAAQRRARANVELLPQVLELRHEIARLLGHKDFPTAALDGRMAETPERVWSFLNELGASLRERGRQEIAELLAAKRQDEPGAAALNAWDTAYYTQKIVRERFGLDEKELAAYFPIDRVIEGTLKVYERVLGLKFAELPAADAWHPEVRLFEVRDGDGSLIGHFYMDLFPRPGKYDHAAAFGIIAGRELEDGGYRRPVSAIVANFPRGEAGKPALLPFGDVSTFFHEFGHIMHQVLTRARHASMSGSRVARDFVEAPSQMMENFIWEPEVLRELSAHWQSGAPLPEELRQRLLAASRFYDEGSGVPRALHFLGQVGLATIDMLFHTAVPKQTTRLWYQVMEWIRGIPQPQDGAPEASFGHLMGYAAGYYGYLWSLVFADDIYSVFKREGLFGPVGLRYRREILERGSSRPELESLRRFLGREPSNEAFMRKLRGEDEPGA